MSTGRFRGKGSITVGCKGPMFYKEYDVSPDLGIHQGIATDGVDYYIFHTTFIKRCNSAWVTQAENNDLCDADQMTDAYNHCGDGCYYDGKIYAPFVMDVDDRLPTAIGVFNATDLTFIEKHDLSAEGVDIASCYVDGPNDTVYCVSYWEFPTKVRKYKLSDWSYIGVITPSIQFTNVQGISKGLDGYLYVSGWYVVYRMDTSGTISQTMLNLTTNEGIDFTTEKALCVHDPGSNHGAVHIGHLFGKSGRAIEAVLTLPCAISSIPGFTGAWVSNFFTSDNNDNVFYFRDTAPSGLIYKSVHSDGADPRPLVPPADIPIGKELHLVGVDDLVSTKIYINGVLYQSVDRTGTLNDIATSWYIGVQAGIGPYVDIRKIRFYAAPLSAADVSQKYSEYVSGNRSVDYRCIGDWGMLPVAGKIPDESGYGNHGTISGEINFLSSAGRIRR